jgi:uncharacterized LabA/DUF88 family protein
MRTLCFIDAANLFYGGLKSLGWKIDYQKLRLYLISKYQAEEFHYFGGVEIYDFKFDALAFESVPVYELVDFLEVKIGNFRGNKKEFCELYKNYERAKFFRKLADFGYVLHLKPVKTFKDGDQIKKKANCDVDMTFYMMRDCLRFDRLIVLSGDGDFLIVLKYLKSIGKKILIMARGERTARDIRRFVGSEFLAFEKLRKYISQL